MTSRAATLLRCLRRGWRGLEPGFEILAIRATADVELITDHRKPHGMGAIKELAVFDRVEPDILRDFCGAAAIPARAVACLRFGHGGPAYLACCGMYPGGSAAPSPKKKSSMCLATRSWASFCQGMSRYSFRIIFIRSSQSFQASVEM